MTTLYFTSKLPEVLTFLLILKITQNKPMQNKLTKNNLIILVVLLLIIGSVVYYKNRKPALAPGVLSYEEYLQQGINYETKGELNNAIISYKKASEISPKDYVPYSNIGSAYLTMVALDEKGRPSKVPGLILETKEQIKKNRIIQLRRKRRIEHLRESLE